jgi:hypothetical protein
MNHLMMAESQTKGVESVFRDPDGNLINMFTRLANIKARRA